MLELSPFPLPKLISPFIYIVAIMDRLFLETVRKGDILTFRKLIQENEDLIKQTTSASSNTILHLAAQFGHFDLASEIVNLCPEMVVAENQELETPLHEACREGKVEITRLLMEANDGVVYKVNCREESALFVSCERGRVEVVKHLLNFPWLLMMEVDASTTSVHVAASAGHTEIVKEILKVRPDFGTKRTSLGYTPLHIACSRGHLDTTRELLRFDPDFSFLQDNQGLTPLHWAAMKGRVNMIDEILSTSLESAHMITNYGETILHLAVKNNQFESVKFLMEKLNTTKLVNLQDNDGNTILHLATSGKLKTMVIYLLKFAIEVNILNRRGYTALDVVESDASNSGTLAIVPALEQVGGKRCDQLPPHSQDIQQIKDPIFRQHLSVANYTHVESPAKQHHHHHHRKQSHRRSKQHELQKEGLRNARNTITVVAVLIATVTFSAGINPPGGFDQDSGKAIMGRRKPFKVFMVCNIMALFLSLGIVNVLVSVIPFKRKSMTKLLTSTHKVMWVSTLFMASAYTAAVWTILPEDRGSRWVIGEMVFVGVGSTLIVYFGLGFLLAKHWMRKREWRERKEQKIKDGSPNGSINSRVEEMRVMKKSRESSSNSDVDSSDNGYHVF